MYKFSRMRGLLLAILALLVVVGISVAQDGEKNLYLNWGGPGDIPSADPVIPTDVTSIQIILELWPGLSLNHEATLENLPAMATWDISDDGLTYTFNIVPEVSWVKYNMDSGEVEQVMVDGSPRYVTAADFKYGMMRAMDPRNASYYGSLTAPYVVGGAELYGSTDGLAEDAPAEEVDAAVEAAMEGVMIETPDDYTLVVHLTQPAGYAPQVLGWWATVAQPQWVIEEFGDAWTEPENVVSYGPFVMSEWLHAESLTLSKNPFWAGTDNIPVPAIDNVVGVMLAADAALANYEAGTLDAVGVPGADLDRIVADPTLSQEYSTGPGVCSFYQAFNTTKAPTDDVRVRRALSMSIDRELLSETIWKPAIPAYFFSISILNAAPTQDQYPELAIQEDVAAAQALMQEYIDEVGGPITLTQIYRTGSTTGELTAAALQEMWQDAFGADNVSVETSSQEWAVFLETRRSAETAPNVWGLGWCQDYTDTNNFLYDVWNSNVMLNGTGFYSEEFDRLTEEAQVLTDTEARRDLYAQAEYILTNEVATMMPTYYNASSRLTKPYVDRPQAVANVFQFELWDVNR